MAGLSAVLRKVLEPFQPLRQRRLSVPCRCEYFLGSVHHPRSHYIAAHAIYQPTLRIIAEQLPRSSPYFQAQITGFTRSALPGPVAVPKSKAPSTGSLQSGSSLNSGQPQRRSPGLLLPTVMGTQFYLLMPAGMCLPTAFVLRIKCEKAEKCQHLLLSLILPSISNDTWYLASSLCSFSFNSQSEAGAMP